MQQREPKEVVAAAVKFLLERQVPRQKLADVLASWGSYTPEKLAEAMFVTGELAMDAGDLVKRAFRDTIPAYDERLMAEWHAWLSLLAAWGDVRVLHAKYQRNPADVVHDLFDPRN
jgi:hypothetical protein